MAPALSTSEHRREAVVSSAITAFSRTGYLGTPIAAVAEHAAISPAYVFKLFPGKEALFVAALDSCFDRIIDALEQGAASAVDTSPDGILDSMGGAYAELIADRQLLMLQVHALSAADVIPIGDALRRGLARVTRFASTRSGAADASVQRFVAYGQLCHLIVTAGVENIPEDWARLVSAGIRHP
jgi:AcrR family transcriptional regulator